MVRISFYLILFIILVLLRIHLLDSIGLAEYDSVKNFFIVKNIANGDFSQMFQHGSPTFFLFFAVIYKLFPSFLAVEYANAAVSVAAILLFINWVEKYFVLTPLKLLLAGFYVGSSVFLIYSARSFAIESLTLLLFLALLQAYLAQKQLKFWILVALLLTVNYKIILFLPIIFLIDFYEIFYLNLNKNNKSIFSYEIVYLLYRKYYYVPYLLFAPFVFYTLFGIIVGVSWKAYIGHWLMVLVIRKNLNPWTTISTINWDIDYYFRYFWTFECPALLVGIGSFLYFYKKQLFGKQVLSVEKILFAIILFTICTMSVLPKAPRGLLLIFPLLYGLAFMGIDTLTNRLFYILNIKFYYLKSLIFTCIIGLLICQHLYQAYQTVYQYATYTSYKKLIQYLEYNNITKFTSTVGINSKTFLPTTIQMQSILFPDDQIKLKDYNYCLIDDYYQIAGTQVFDKWKQSEKVIWSAKEPTLLSPLLYLEHCEFTGNTFDQALKKQQKVANDTAQLRLIKL